MALDINEVNAGPLHDASASALETRQSNVFNLGATFFTTLTIFGIYFGQGIVVARILGPIGRGEFGHALYFPRDILLYAGLLGGIEIVNSLASKQVAQATQLKYAAAKLGLTSGIITALMAALLSVCFLFSVGKPYLIPACLLVCLFVPFEHMQLTVSAVDRGNKAFFRYNWNRFIYAFAFLGFMIIGFGADELVSTMQSLPPWLMEACSNWTGFNHLMPCSGLTFTCLLFVAARVIALAPTLQGMDLWKQLLKRKQAAVSSETASLDDDSLETKKLLRQGRPFALSMLVSEVFDRLDIFLIMALAATIDIAGQYFVAVPAAALMIVAPNALTVFTFNAGADSSQKITVRTAVLVMTGTIVFQAIVTVLFALVLPMLILSFFGQQFEPAIEFALWLLPASAIKGYLQAADGFLKGRDKPMLGVWARMIGIGLMLVFVAVTYQRLGLISIPISACFGQLFCMIVISVGVLRDVKQNCEVSHA